MSRFGPVRDVDYDKESQLWEWLNQGGYGVMGITDAPKECIEFILQQYARFGVPVLQSTMEIVERSAAAVFCYLDFVDPYLLFQGDSDVNMTMDWSQFAYEIHDTLTGGYYEAAPEFLESYTYDPRQCEDRFNYYMSHPGLENIHPSADLEEMLFGEMWGESVASLVDREAIRAMEELCRRPDGVVDWDRINAFIRLGAWAAYVWVMGPPGFEFRRLNHDIFHVAVIEGEAILLDGCVIGPSSYRKLPRSPMSCYKCGIAAWCIELCMVDGGSRYICEHCLSEGMPKTRLASCGSKQCMLTVCPHHPYHHLGSAGLHNYMRDHGQLRASANGHTTTRILGERKALMG